MINFNNTYSKLPEAFFTFEKAASFPKPSLLIFNEDLAQEFGINFQNKSEKELAQIFSGQTLLKGSEPLAMAYAAHQFGHFVHQLGDGRALLLGETKGYDIQLKGSGPTHFSRQGDGKSALGPVIREYILSEAMHNLGVPTTRSLAAIATNEDVHRNEIEPGGILTRISPSHLRVGTFQFFAARQDNKNLQILLDYAIKKHYPDANGPLDFLVQVAKAQSRLVAQWMSLGFVHGVMNTDNSSIAGVTIDYGPCAFMDEFKFHKVFSSIDRNGRYSFMNQGPITQWNMLRLAECLIPFIDDNTDKAISKIEETLSFLPAQIKEDYNKRISRKLGLEKVNEELNQKFLEYLEKEELDFTLSFRNLPLLFNQDNHGYPKTEELEYFLKKWKPLVNVMNLDEINPLYIPRNHQVQRIIDDCYAGNHQSFFDLNSVLKNPFTENKKLDYFKEPPRSDQRITQTFCGT